MSKQRCTPLVAALAAAAMGGPAFAETVQIRLESFQEVPSVVSAASGSFRAFIDGPQQRIAFQLDYRDLRGDVTQAHIHLGQASANGAVMVFLCTNLGNGPAGTPLCPPSPGSVSGELVADDVLTIAGQGLDAGDFDALVESIRAGVAYVNVHSTRFPPGEIRGQFRGRGR